MSNQTAPSPAQVKRYGVRLVVFLGLGLTALALSTVQGGYTLLSLLLLLVGFGGAVWNTACGLAGIVAVPPNHRAQGRVEDTGG